MTALLAGARSGEPPQRREVARAELWRSLRTLNALQAEDEEAQSLVPRGRSRAGPRSCSCPSTPAWSAWARKRHHHSAGIRSRHIGVRAGIRTNPKAAEYLRILDLLPTALVA
jgi:hypothetical protein